MTLLGALRHARKEHLAACAYWLIPTYLGGLMPLWGSAILLSLLSQPPSLESYLLGGELMVFSMSVLWSAQFTMSRRPGWVAKAVERSLGQSMSELSIPGNALFLLVSIPLSGVTTIAFSATVISQLPGDTMVPNMLLFRWVTWVALGASLIVGFIANLLDTVCDERSLDVHKEADKRQAGLEAALDSKLSAEGCDGC